MFMVYSKKIRDFPGGPVVKSPPANAEDSGSIPGRGAKIPHAWQPKDQNIKRSNIVANSIRNSKNDPHQKNHLISATDGILESCLKAVFTKSSHQPVGFCFPIELMDHIRIPPYYLSATFFLGGFILLFALPGS